MGPIFSIVVASHVPKDAPAALQQPYVLNAERNILCVQEPAIPLLNSLAHVTTSQEYVAAALVIFS